ncbi:LLM class flavin-dependent oxidoreductase [Streptomyces milbemycinicus]|uniref:LLM class flavin-dependent oxidoreductase n=1 Tax=Streptomyces milbemycinicus TaxID=476552 RepID=A0ABW8LUU2_9ACTN
MLDTAPVWQDSTPAAALRESVELARRVDRVGYRRYWVAEHHNAPFIASCAPPALVGQLASSTRHLRVGSGGVMLPNHPPLVIAEQFGTLEALNPGRIDLGIGRSPGTDPNTARALRRVSSPSDSPVFKEQLAELLGYFEPMEPDALGRRIAAVPATDSRPEVWLLGSSIDNARHAGALGLPFAYAHHIRPAGTVDALAAYRDAFRASTTLERPYAIISAAVIAADSDERAAWLAGPVGAILLDKDMRVRNTANPTPHDVAVRAYTAVERATMRRHMEAHLIGGPDTIRERAAELLARTGADELMALSLIHGLDDRARSYELLAQALLPVDTHVG